MEVNRAINISKARRARPQLTSLKADSSVPAYRAQR
jgi:hypothetical protein